MRVDSHRHRRRSRRRQSQREAIDANLDHGLFQVRNESSNTKIGLLTPIAFGFHGLYLYPSSPSHYSPSVATHHNSQAETDPRIQQESDITAHIERGKAAKYCRVWAVALGDISPISGAALSGMVSP